MTSFCLCFVIARVKNWVNEGAEIEWIKKTKSLAKQKNTNF